MTFFYGTKCRQSLPVQADQWEPVGREPDSVPRGEPRLQQGRGAERWKAARARPEFASRASWPRLEPARELAAAHGERGR